MVIKKILSGYTSIFLALLRFLTLMAICVGAGILVVWPLWKLADSDPNLYTLVFGIIAAAIVLFIAVTGMRRSFVRNRRRFVISAFRKLTIIAGIGVPVTLVLSWHRLAALVVLVAAIALYGFLAFALDIDKGPKAEMPSRP
jgi:hypothetical protein